MSITRALRFMAILLWVLTGTRSVLGEGADMSVDGVISYIRQNLAGNGRIVVIASAGPNRPENEMLYFVDYEAQKKTNLDWVYHARWLSTSEIIAQQTYEPMPGSIGNRIIRVDRDGHLLEVLSAQEGVTGPVPNSIGQWAAFKIDIKTGVMQGVEFHELHDKSVFPAFVQFGPGKEVIKLSDIVWSPERNAVALAAWVNTKRGYVPRIGIMSNAAEGVRILNNDVSFVARPLFWKDEWLYAASDKGLLRCSPLGGCEAVYTPGGGRNIVGGIAVENGKAVLLVQNIGRDPFEIRATEIHEVNLRNGIGEGVFTLPEGVFVNDMDWISRSK